MTFVPLTDREKLLVGTAIQIRYRLCQEDEYDESPAIKMLNDALEEYGVAPSEQGDHTMIVWNPDA